LLRKVQGSKFKVAVGRKNAAHSALKPAPQDGGRGRPPYQPFHYFERAKGSGTVAQRLKQKEGFLK
jgi:hypothetical protein